MKVQVLFDETGNVNAVLYPSPQTGSTGSLAAEPIAILKPCDGQNTATLKVPSELRELTPAQLHSAIRVNLRGGTPRLIAKD